MLLRFRYFVLLLSCCMAVAIAGCKKQKLDWQHAQQITTNTTDRLNEVMFVNDTLGFAVGGQRFYTATVLTTHDGGNTWKLDSFPEVGKGLYGIAAHKGVIYLIGLDGRLQYSSDNGNTWRMSQLNAWESFKDLAFAGDRCIGIAGINFDYGFLCDINVSPAANQGIDVTTREKRDFELNDIEMASDKVGYICGFGNMLKTTDGGATWQHQDIKNDNFTGISVLDEQRAWTCGYNGSIHYTQNGGAKWEKLRGANNALGTKYHFLDILFLNTQDGWAVGENGVVVSTTDGGRNWKEYDRFTANALRSIVQAPDGSMVVAGDNGTLYKLAQ